MILQGMNNIKEQEKELNGKMVEPYLSTITMVPVAVIPVALS